MSYAAGFAAGEAESFAHRRAGTTPSIPNDRALSAYEHGRRDALFPRSQAWAMQPPHQPVSNAIARPAEELAP